MTFELIMRNNLNRNIYIVLIHSIIPVKGRLFRVEGNIMYIKSRDGFVSMLRKEDIRAILPLEEEEEQNV